MALEDAICLADCVDQRDGEFPAAFKAYPDCSVGSRSTVLADVGSVEIQDSQIGMSVIQAPKGV